MSKITIIFFVFKAAPLAQAQNILLKKQF